MDNDTEKSEMENLRVTKNIFTDFEKIYRGQIEELRICKEGLEKTIEEHKEYTRFVMENLECEAGYCITKITKLKDVIAQKRLKEDLADKEAEELKYYEALFRLDEKKIAFCEKVLKPNEELTAFYEKSKEEHKDIMTKIRSTIIECEKKFNKQPSQ